MSLSTAGCALFAGAVFATVAATRIRRAPDHVETLRLVASILLFCSGGLLVITSIWHVMLGGSLHVFLSADPFYRGINFRWHLVYAAFSAGIVFYFFYLIAKLNRSRGAA